LARALEKNADLFLPKAMVDEKVYFVPNLPVYLTGTLRNNEWCVNDEPCKLDPETNLYFANVRRHLNQ
jgi:hypothetical protein